jgi:hypothetical protein
MNARSAAPRPLTATPPAAVEDFERYNRDFPVEYFREAAADLRRLTAQSASDPAVIAKLLTERVRSRIPTSLVRLSDGEGNVLFADQDAYPELRDFLLGRMGAMQFGSRTDVLMQNAALFAAWTKEASSSADFLGVPPPEMVFGAYLCPPEQRNYRSICGNRHAFAAAVNLARTGALKEAIIVPAFVSRHLKDHYQAIVQAAGAIVILGSHDITRAMRDFSGVQDVRHIAVPLQSLQMRGQPNDHYPEAFRRIVAEIDTIAPESLVLVGAGPLGKHYCHLIKGRGSIALDVGAVMDLWAGKSGRGPVTADMLAQWRLA